MPAPKDMTAKAALLSIKAELRKSVREALQRLMEEMVELHGGDHGKAGIAMGLLQPEVTEIRRGRIPRADKIVLIATKLGRSTDSILGLTTPELTHARDLYLILRRQFEHTSDTQDELERAGEALRPSKLPAPSSHTATEPRTKKHRRVR